MNIVLGFIGWYIKKKENKVVKTEFLTVFGLSPKFWCSATKRWIYRGRV